jgi:Transglycosylase SLT domain
MPAPAPKPKPSPAPAAEGPAPTPTPGPKPRPAPVSQPTSAPTPVAAPDAVSPPRDAGAPPRRRRPHRSRANVRVGVGAVPPPATQAPAPPAARPLPAPSGGSPAPISPGYALSAPQTAFRMPPFLLRIYHAAAKRYEVPWQILAAINEIETDYGRNLNVSSAGAVGWMQFMPATWAMYGVDANRDGVKDPYSPVDAIFAAARYLRAAGADTDLRRAVFAYNHADWYVDMVMLRARVIEGMSGHFVGTTLRLSDERLIRRVLDDPRIEIYECGRADIVSGQIDPRVLATMLYLAESGLKPTVTSLKCGHGYLTSSGNVSEHATGTAMDIGAINGLTISRSTQGRGSITDLTIQALLELDGTMKPHQIISLMTFKGADNTFSMSDHDDHIHVGWQPARG